MKPPPDFQFLKNKSKVYKLKAALYGMKQLPRAWSERFQAANQKNESFYLKESMS